MIDLFLMLTVIFIEINLVTFAGLLVQGIVYWTTGFSIYNWLNKVLF